MNVSVFALLAWWGRLPGSPTELTMCGIYLLATQCNGLYQSITFGLQRFRTVAVISGISALLQVVAALLLIPRFGVSGDGQHSIANCRAADRRNAQKNPLRYSSLKMISWSAW